MCALIASDSALRFLRHNCVSGWDRPRHGSAGYSQQNCISTLRRSVADRPHNLPHLRCTRASRDSSRGPTRAAYGRHALSPRRTSGSALPSGCSLADAHPIPTPLRWSCRPSREDRICLINSSVPRNGRLEQRLSYNWRVSMRFLASRADQQRRR